ncbi:unnamed protein product [Heligmosomoides polygyrus]|uniref:AA_permease domain-containing protein n=1 Tax=Heligmosomoides polygyrus TaxID=6339 RepID=A0A183GWJ1_HELPZ|nr:unnamed protein product [Heligmosomoides polygyrus]
MVWVTATAPYIVLTILLIRGVTLPGAAKGIYYYLTPDFSKLNDPKSCYRSQLTFRDAIVTSSINCLTSFFSGFVIFSTLGYMAELTNKEVSEVVGDHDASLIFIVYPQALATMSYSSAWSFIFFVMLITLGIDSTVTAEIALVVLFLFAHFLILPASKYSIIFMICLYPDAYKCNNLLDAKLLYIGCLKKYIYTLFERR